VNDLRYISLVNLLLIGAFCGCRPAPEEPAPIWEHIRLGDLTPRTDGQQTQAELLASVHLDIFVIDIPLANIEQLDEVWPALSTGAIRVNNYEAFSANGLRARSGRLDDWPEVERLLTAAGGRVNMTTSAALSEDAPSDLPVAELPRGGTISFVGTDLTRETANVGIGLLVLRFEAQRVGAMRGVRQIVAHPVFAPPMAVAIPELQAELQDSEFHFAPAALAAQMSPGDLIMLGPNGYISERSALGAMLFNEPQQVLFLDPQRRQAPEKKPAVRIFVIVCTRIND
jgi:hypothetical protein